VLVLAFFLPSDFPHHGKAYVDKSRVLSRRSMQRLDFLGAFLLIGANLLLVTALLEASTTFSWHSPVIIVLLALSGMLWISFVIWEWFVTRRDKPEPVFPFRFFLNRYWMGMLL
jgi:Zn-dependent protease with chaperone function